MNNRPPEPPRRNQRDDGPNGNDPNNPRSGNGNNNEGPGGNPNPNTQRIWLGVGAVAIVILLIMMTGSNTFSARNDYSVNLLVREIEAGNVASITQEGDTKVYIEFRQGGSRSMAIAPGTEIREMLLNYEIAANDLDRVEFFYRASDNTGTILFQLLVGFVPVLLIVWLIWRMMRSMRAGQDQAMNFGRSRARVARDMERPQVTFNDVAGADEAKEELREIVEFLKEPEKFIRLGARVPKGVLMVGPPGTGKTLMARAVAGEAGVPFFSISGSEFVEMFVGVGASRVRDLFDRSKAESPAIVFIDEIDAVGRHRGAGLGGGHDEREQTLNQILVEMDGFETGTNVIIIAATNRPDILDPALLRPGRFDRKVIMDNPDVKGRLEILKVHAKGKPLAPDADLEAMSRITAGFSGADLENLINEAAILAARRNLKTIGMSELQESMERVVMGPERKTRVISEKEKRSIAYHEAGHALVHHHMENLGPIHKITIVSRGRAGGFVMPLPEGDHGLYTREYFQDMIAFAMGGRAAEELTFGQFTTGASQDLQQATSQARAMVMQFGMSERLGPRSYGRSGQQVFLGREISEQRDYSEHFAEEIDKEVGNILQVSYERAKKILTDNQQKLDKLAEVLIEQETLDRQSFEDLMANDAILGATPALFDGND